MPETVEVQTHIPMTARVVDSGPNRTLVEFVIFGKPLIYTMGSDDHRLRAEVVMDEWAAHFATEWEKVQQTSEALMHQFSDALRAEGVSDEIIDKAVASVVEYVKG